MLGMPSLDFRTRARHPVCSVATLPRPLLRAGIKVDAQAQCPRCILLPVPVAACLPSLGAHSNNELTSLPKLEAHAVASPWFMPRLDVRSARIRRQRGSV